MYVVLDLFFFFFFKQKTAYEMRISDWSSDVCSSDLCPLGIDGSNTADFKNFSGDVTVRWKPTDDIMTYLKYARGFKSGGWNPSAPSLEAAGPADPEIVDEFEFGLKADFFDRHQIGRASCRERVCQYV